jgi:hypothetical protein
MFSYLTMIFLTKAFLVFSREFTNQLNRCKKSTRADALTVESPLFEKQKMYDQADFLCGAGLL